MHFFNKLSRVCVQNLDVPAKNIYCQEQVVKAQKKSFLVEMKNKMLLQSLRIL